MRELPSPHEEDHLGEGFLRVRGEHMDDSAGTVADGLRHAAAANELGGELAHERRIVNAYGDAHRSRLSEIDQAADLDQGLVVLDPSTSVTPARKREGEVMRTLVDLASRRGGGIEVALIWDPDAKTLVVFAHDERTDEEIAIPVNGEEATEVYRHPFAYAHRSSAAPVRQQAAARASRRRR